MVRMSENLLGNWTSIRNAGLLDMLQEHTLGFQCLLKKTPSARLLVLFKVGHLDWTGFCRSKLIFKTQFQTHSPK